jgi:hypothetical protein
MHYGAIDAICLIPMYRAIQAVSAGSPEYRGILARTKRLRFEAKIEVFDN